MIGPALYVGTLRHRRFRPRPHEFTYKLFMALVDVDRVHDQMRVSAFTSVNRFNWASFNDRDHLGDPTRPLRARVTEDAARNGIRLPDGPIYLLTHLSYLGYAFNPISFYYCCDADSRVVHVMCEVNSTFGEQCTYWLPTPDADRPRSFRHRTAKTMHVSPFMSMDVDYEFVVTPPAERVVAHMNTIERTEGSSRPYFDATLVLERRAWTAATLRGLLVRHPWMTAKVIGAIHWEALKLWLKGVPRHPHPKDAAVRSESRAGGQRMTWIDRQAKRLFLNAADTITHGSIELVCPERTHAFAGAGPGEAGMMLIHDERTFRRAILEGDRGLGEAYLDGDWSSPDLVALLRMTLRNHHAFNRLNGPWSWIARQGWRAAHRLRSNTRTGSRDNVSAHYDLGNEFFQLFLDRELLYSSAWFEHDDDSLERAQVAKLDRLCRKLQLDPSDHLLEIGTGWGALAIHAATHYGCRVTTTTISREQYGYTRGRLQTLGDAGARITLLADDYRDLKGQFTKIVSCEMFEAVGLEHYDDFFRACERLTAPGGAVLLQTITINEQDFRSRYGRNEDWMQGHIFPGSELASLSEMLRSIGRVTGFRPFHLEDLGTHYARTIALWRERFAARRDAVLRLGFDERFVRMWELYLAFSEAAFAERHISDVQLLLTRAYHDGTYFDEPWGRRTAHATVRRP